VKKYATLAGFLLTALLMLAFTQPQVSTQAQSSIFTIAHPTVVSLAPSDLYSVTGKPTISASFINRVLAAYHSPARGRGQALSSLGVKYGIDPVYALAFFLHESRFGTTGEARVTLSLGNERCITDRPCIDRQLGGYAQMESWEDGFEHWYMLILYGYVQGQVTIPLVGHTCKTIDQIVPVYAPSSDHNNVEAYIQAIKSAVDTWRAGRIFVSGIVS
jgi:hypothetical protein